MVGAPPPPNENPAYATEMERLETLLMTVVWHIILERFNATSLSLQKVDMELIRSSTILLLHFFFNCETELMKKKRRLSHMLKSRITKKQL